MVEKLHIAVVYGSVRDGRQGIKAAKFVIKEFERRKHFVKLVDPLEYDIPLLKKMYKEYGEGEAPENLQKLHDLFTKADAIVVVSAEYNHSIPPALSNLLDHFMPEFFHKPSGIVTYSAGPFGGVRAGVHLRDLLGELGMSAIPSMFPISKIQDFSNDGEPSEERYKERIKKFLDELEWYSYALKEARSKGVPY
jgi:NAD(P)H-dependent FMN reductase